MGRNDAREEAPDAAREQAPDEAPNATTRRALRALAFGNIVIGTGALAFVGMLDVVARDLRESPSAIGFIAGMFSLGICLSGPVLGAVTSRFDRRTVLAVSLAVFAVGHFAAAAADGYWELLAIRVATSFAGSIFTPQAAATASLLVTPARRARTMSFVFLGWAIAAVLGMPAGAWIATHFGWRIAMSGIGVLSAVGAIAVLAAVPARLFAARIDAAAWRAIATHPTLLRVVSVTALHASAQFALYSYVVIAYQDALRATPPMVTGLLSLMGLAGFVGNLAAGRAANRIGTPAVIVVALSTMTGAFAVWTLVYAAGPGPVAVALAVVASLMWGAGNFAANGMQQVRLVDIAPALASVSVALNTSAIYLGQFIGAAVGGLALAHPLAEPASRALPWLALPLFFVAIAVSILTQRRVERLRSPVHPLPSSP